MMRPATLVTLLMVATMTVVAGTSPAVAKTRVTPFERTIAKQVNAVRAGEGLVPLRPAAPMAACHKRYADQAVLRMSRQGRFAPRMLSGVRENCPSKVLRTTGVRARKAKVAARVMMRRPLVRRAVMSKPARTISLGTRRNGDGTWSVVAVVGGPRKAVTTEAGQMRRAIYTDTNAARAAHGRKALKADKCLQANAQRWAKALARKGGLEHQVLETVWDDCGQSSWVGENVAYRSDSDGAAMTVQWMNSPGHRANILNTRPALIGVGVASDGKGRWYGVQVFSGAYW
jgi:uncharacterized protein YkwD